MRSSKSRSRSKPNRNRSVGNIVNRVFDSSGPEGKVRGTPQQIIEKYNQLARDAQLSNDRVAAENFQQHAEHYVRLLGEAQREADARREQQEQQQNRDRDRHREREDGRPAEGHDQSGGENRPGNADAQSETAPASERGQREQKSDKNVEPADVVDQSGSSGDDSGLVETPETAAEKPAPKPRARKPRARKPKAADGDNRGSGEGEGGDSGAGPREAAE